MFGYDRFNSYLVYVWFVNIIEINKLIHSRLIILTLFVHRLNIKMAKENIDFGATNLLLNIHRFKWEILSFTTFALNFISFRATNRRDEKTKIISGHVK